MTLDYQCPVSVKLVPDLDSQCSTHSFHHIHFLLVKVEKPLVGGERKSFSKAFTFRVTPLLEANWSQGCSENISTCLGGLLKAG